jgi:hypothetical protein
MARFDASPNGTSGARRRTTSARRAFCVKLTDPARHRGCDSECGCLPRRCRRRSCGLMFGETAEEIGRTSPIVRPILDLGAGRSFASNAVASRIEMTRLRMYAPYGISEYLPKWLHLCVVILKGKAGVFKYDKVMTIDSTSGKKRRQPECTTLEYPVFRQRFFCL